MVADHFVMDHEVIHFLKITKLASSTFIMIIPGGRQGMREDIKQGNKI